MSSMNPYAPPTARVEDRGTAAEFQPIQLWSARGRLGRVRYFAYPVIATFVFYLVSAVLMGLSTAIGMPALGFVLVAVAGLALMGLGVMWAIQRCHDLDWSGWWAILVLVPLANFIFWLLLLFIPGTPGVNRYGAPPPPNKGAIWLAVGAVVAIFAVGILAAIAIPAYQDYVNRARAAQQ